MENHNFRLLNKIQRILNLHLTLNVSLYHVYSGEGFVVNVKCDNRLISSFSNSCSNVSCLVAFCILKKIKYLDSSQSPVTDISEP